MGTTESNKAVKLILDCEVCGVFKEMEGNEDVLHYAAQTIIDEHWADVHYYPSVRYDWSGE